jgi:tetratricopeptide (TPR) repeat protein
LALVPTYARTYLLLADYFLHEQKSPTFALYAAEKALRDGTCFQEALSRIVACLKKLESPELEVYQFLLSQCQPGSKGSHPSSWQAELTRLTNLQVSYLVMLSAGRAVIGRPELPSPGFGRVTELFKQAKSDDDVMKVLAILVDATEKQPRSAKTYNLIGACYRHLGMEAVALPFLWQALTLEPEYDYALANLGLCCQRLGLMRSARFYFEQEAVKNSPSSWVQESYVTFLQKTK